VERECPDGWAILSAKHGLLMPDQVIAPYDLTLRKTCVDYRVSWASRVNRALLETFPDRRFLVLAGSQYREALGNCSARFALAGCLIWLPHKAPLEGMGIGEQLAWLKARVKA
jgi:hypothetical protein